MGPIEHDKKNREEKAMEKLQVSRREVHEIMKRDECTLVMAFFTIVQPYIDEFYEDCEDCLSEERIVNEFLRPYVEVV